MPYVARAFLPERLKHVPFLLVDIVHSCVEGSPVPVLLLPCAALHKHILSLSHLNGVDKRLLSVNDPKALDALKV